MKLLISEVFYSVQGEGKTSGRPAVFLRLTGCNLLCSSDSWICDTIEVWKKGKATPFEDVLNRYFIEKLDLGAHLIITGGEPLLRQKVLLNYLEWFLDTHGFLPRIEIETNGTIMPSNELAPLVYLFNVSPKLANSGETLERRYKPDVINWFTYQDNSIFKFVISKRTDIDEINQLELPGQKVWLMPAGETKDKLETTRLITVELAKEYCYKYSDRLQVVIWNEATGV